MNEEAERYRKALYLALSRWDEAELSRLRSLDQLKTWAQRYIDEAATLQDTWCPACKEYGQCKDYCDDEYKADVIEWGVI